MPNSLFDPPTPEELEEPTAILEAPPTEEELIEADKPAEPPKPEIAAPTAREREEVDISPTESFARGAIEDITFGSAPHITAAIETALGNVGIGKDQDYKDYLKESQEAYRRAEEINPGAYSAGEVAATVAALATGVGGLAKGAAKMGAKGLAKRSVKDRVKGTLKAMVKEIDTGAIKVGDSSNKVLNHLAKKTGVPRDLVEVSLDVASAGALGPLGIGLSRGMSSLGKYATKRGSKSAVEAAKDVGKDTLKSRVQRFK
jgi:hypothetical protein